MRNSFIIIVYITALSSCSNDIDLVRPDDPIPVVYFRMDPSDSVFYLTLTRSFSVNGNGFEMARNSDLVFYPDPDIRLEGWSGQFKVGETRFRPSGRTKNPGLFPEVPGYCFKSLNEKWRLDDNTQNAGITTFRLVMDLQGKFGPVVSTLPIVPLPIQKRPSRQEKQVNLYPPDSGKFIVEFSFKEGLIKYCELMCTFRYQELAGGNWEDHNFTVPLKKNIMIVTRNGVANATAILYPEQFFNRIAVNIKPVNDTILRRFNSLDLIFLAGDQNYKDYSETYINSGNFDGLPMGNIINGYGLFTMVRSVKMENLILSYKTMDSLAGGQYTRQLGFITW